jgi:putative phage-type endonuclease
MSRPTIFCDLVLPASAPREDWLSARLTGIGSSDASAVVGLNPWRTPLDVWQDKTFPSSDQADNEAMEFGRALEPVVAAAFARRTGKILRRVGLVRSREWPWMLASCDRRVLGERAVVECKTTGLWSASDWDHDEIPDHAVIQVMHQLAVTGDDKAYVPCLIGGQRLEIREIRRDEDAIRALVEQERVFWEDNVLKGQEPEAGASDLATLKERPRGEEEMVSVPADEVRTMIRQRTELATLRKQAEKEERNITARLVQLLGDAAAATVGGEPIYTYYASPRAGYYVAPTTVRTLRITKHGKAL